MRLAYICLYKLDLFDLHYEYNIVYADAQPLSGKTGNGTMGSPSIEYFI